MGDPASCFCAGSAGDSAARSLVERYMPLARSLTRRYGRSSEPFEDLLRVASLGLLKAIDRYGVEREGPFQSFAVPTILRQMRRRLRDSGWAIRPRGARRRGVRRPGRMTERDLADREPACRVPRDRHRRRPRRAQAIQAYETVSLDAPRPGADDDASAYGETIGTDDERYELVELDATLAAVLGHIPPRERLILRMRYVDDLTQTEIAEQVGISQMQVSRLLRRSLDQLRSLTHAPAGAR
jgi:RNA polymerase sigma-B factor